MNVNIQPFQLPITKTTKTVNSGCDEKEPDFFWVVEFGQIVNKEILETASVKNSTPEFPFDVFFIYPSVQFARNLPLPELTTGMIPKSVAIKTVEGAIDLDNDGKPDLLQAFFCCSDTNISPLEDGNCYTCLKTFKKVNERWKLINEAIPC